MRKLHVRELPSKLENRISFSRLRCSHGCARPTRSQNLFKATSVIIINLFQCNKQLCIMIFTKWRKRFLQRLLSEQCVRWAEVRTEVDVEEKMLFESGNKRNEETETFRSTTYIHRRVCHCYHFHHFNLLSILTSSSSSGSVNRARNVFFFSFFIFCCVRCRTVDINSIRRTPLPLVMNGGTCFVRNCSKQENSDFVSNLGPNAICSQFRMKINYNEAISIQFYSLSLALYPSLAFSTKYFFVLFS